MSIKYKTFLTMVQDVETDEDKEGDDVEKNGVVVKSEEVQRLQQLQVRQQHDPMVVFGAADGRSRIHYQYQHTTSVIL
ncbi:unnamed protein product [Absidia cylindrospora]